MPRLHLTVDEVRDDFDNVLGLVQEGDQVILTDGGEPVAAIVPIADMERLQRLGIRLKHAMGEADD